MSRDQNATGEKPIVIVGAGIAGLACARTLDQVGRKVLVIEAADRVGGRCVSDRIDGFTLDRGFQVYLPAYPDAGRLLDLAQLELRNFFAGSLIRKDDEFRVVADPFRHPTEAWQTLAAGVFSVADAARVAALRLRLTARAGRPQPCPAVSTARYLDDLGFSRNAVECFFKPFFGGVFLDPQLSAPAALFEFLFRMFAAGGAAIPARGMSAIPEQLAAALPRGSVLLGCRAAAVDATRVRLEDGEEIEAANVVVATDATDAGRLGSKSPAPIWRGTATLYFSAPSTPLDRPALLLRGDDRGPVNHLCVPSDVAPEYAPAGASLISISVVSKAATLPPEALTATVIEQLARWFGPQVRTWRRIAVCAIRRALPSVPFASGDELARNVRVRPGLYACGDYLANPSINGAVLSGRAAAYAILRDDREHIRLPEAELDDPEAARASGSR